MKYIERDLGDIEKAVIIPIADMHVGAQNFDEKGFIKVRDWIAHTDEAFVVLIGDLLNNATRNSVSDIYSEAVPPQRAKKHVVELLDPIRDKILAVVSGNHDRRIWKESGSDVMEDIALLLGVEKYYDPYGILLVVKVGKHRNGGRINYTIYTTHGTGSGRTAGSKLNVLKRAAEIALADVYVIGHVHSPIVTYDTYFIPDARHRTVVKMPRAFVSVGGFLEWGEYSEERMFPPSLNDVHGTPKIILHGKEKKFEVVV